MKKTLNYKTMEELNAARKIFDTIVGEIDNPNVTSSNSVFNELFAAGTGAAVGGTGSFIALSALGTSGLSAVGITSGLAAAGSVVGGGMVAGIGVLAAPAVVLAAGGVALVSSQKRKRLNNAKHTLLKEAVAKQNEIIESLKNQINISKEELARKEFYIQSLTSLIQELESDLGLNNKPKLS